MSRILFLSQLVPYPPDAGPKIRSYYVVKQLSQTHKITLLAFSRADDTQEAIKHLNEFCEEIHLVRIKRSQIRNILAMAVSLLRGNSFLIERDIVRTMEQEIETLLKTKHFDIIHTDQLWMAHYALHGRKTSPNIKLLIDEHNACFQVWQRLANGEHNPVKRLFLEYEWRKLRNYEAYACINFDHIVTVTEEDQTIIRKLVASQKNQSLQTYPHTPVFTTIPICIDTQTTAPIQPIEMPSEVLHLGTMFWMPNIEGVLWFARQVWPKVSERVNQAKLIIGGKNPPDIIRELTRLKDGGSSIEVTGYIPDPTKYLKRAGVFIVPLLSGGGMRVKIIDAWRWGLPIVSTSIGAEGILHQPGENILIADNEEDFANAVIKVLEEPEFAKKLRINGRRWAEENYDWHSVYPKWDHIYTELSTN
jgi:polysaccharide biosynthesis protein PslH